MNTSMRNTIALTDGIISGQYHLRQLFDYLQRLKHEPNTVFSNCAIDPRILRDKSCKISYLQYRDALIYSQNILE